jgi:APA family basic amino acid/polyamine antiporter
MGAYAGWSTPCYFTAENVAPGKAIPRALFLGILLTAILYLGVNWVLLHALGVHGVASSPLPFTVVLNHFGGAAPSILFALTAMVTVASCCNACVMAAPRILFALASDRLLPRVLTNVNGGGSPAVAYVMTAAGTLTLAASGTFALVFGLIATLNAVAGVLTEAAFWVLRWREPELTRPYRAFGYPVLPAIPILTDASIVVLFVSADYTGGLVALAMGLVCIPFAYAAHKARKAALA